MTTPSVPVPAAGGSVSHHSSPLDIDSERVALYAPEFAANPHHYYRQMRARYGALVPIYLAPGVPATLIIGYRAAVRVLHDPDHFPADPRRWETTVAPDCPILPVLQWRPNALRSTGFEHTRYRQVNTASIDGVDLHALRADVEQIAVRLIGSFSSAGAADLIEQYAFPLAFHIINAMLGCPPEIGQRIASATATIFDGIDAEQGNRMLTAAVLELMDRKRVDPGDDITTRVLQHPAELSDPEVIHQLVVLHGAGIEPLQNLIINTLLLVLTDDRFAGNFIAGSLSTRDALDEVLFTDPPISNFCVTYPPQPVLIDDVWLPADQPVVISLAGCNNDPLVAVGDRTGNRSHLAWSAGPHACPARSAAYLIAQDAVDQLLDALPDLRLAIPASELAWRPGPFHRALVELPVVFPPVAHSIAR